MKVYKFRSLDNLHLVLEILFRKQLYCAPASELNDIREADIRLGRSKDRESEFAIFGRNVAKEIGELRVCSLTANFQNHLLWAHYAGGSSGIAIEFDIDDEELHKIRYSDEHLFLTDFNESVSPEAAARQVLSRKYEDWKYEQEVRLLSKSAFYPLKKPISRVIVGSKIGIPVLGALTLVCKHFDIELVRLVISDHGMYTLDSKTIRMLRHYFPDYRDDAPPED